MPGWPFSRSATQKDAQQLLSRVTEASRNPAFFGVGQAADTLEGRFELVTLHAALALIRLKASPDTAGLAQAFVDELFRQIDSGLREDGVGDTVVSKRIHELAGAFYGRSEAYAVAIAEGGDALSAVIARNVFGGDQHAFADDVARHVRGVAELQAQSPWQALLTTAGWPPYAA